MKSAYEIAMERLRQEGGETRKLTDDQRKRIHDIDEKYRAQIAEKQLTIESRLALASMEERADLEHELSEITRQLETRAEQEKEAVWNEAG